MGPTLCGNERAMAEWASACYTGRTHVNCLLQVLK